MMIFREALADKSLSQSQVDKQIETFAVVISWYRDALKTGRLCWLGLTNRSLPFARWETDLSVAAS